MNSLKEKFASENEMWRLYCQDKSPEAGMRHHHISQCPQEMWLKYIFGHKPKAAVFLLKLQSLEQPSPGEYVPLGAIWNKSQQQKLKRRQQ